MKRKSTKPMEKKASTAKPQRLSKAGEWLRDNPKGLGGRILDMRAVMR